MADKNLRARVTGLASQALSHPVSKAARGKAVDTAKGVTGAAVGALRNRGGADEARDTGTGSPADEEQQSTGPDASLSTAEPVGAPAEDTLESAGSSHEDATDAPVDTLTDLPAADATDSGDAAQADAAEDPAGPDAAAGAPETDLLPYPDLEPPVPIVEDVLAAEAENGPPTGGHATEPHASTRDEEHGDAQLQRAEQEEIAEEVAEALPGGDLDLETPVGTTGADVGHNPDTAESDLQQPGTAPGVEPGLASSVLKDEERGRAAASGPDERRSS